MSHYWKMRLLQKEVVELKKQNEESGKKEKELKNKISSLNEQISKRTPKFDCLSVSQAVPLATRLKHHGFSNPPIALKASEIASITIHCA